MQPDQIYKSVENEFAAVDQLIQSQLSSQVPLVESISHYIVESGGKRLRPLVVLLTYRALSNGDDSPPLDQNAIKLATIIEFLHTATLLHDDVVDTSSLRRGRDTANAKWGNAPSILVGDFLYSRAFQMMVDIGNLDVMSILADATNVIAEGEVLQLTNCKNPDLTLEQYMQVITAKTAKLFEAASHSATTLLSAPAKDCEAMRQFGLELGIAFQLIDDTLDYTGDPAEMGKNVGDDLSEGKPTLPLLYAQNNTTPEERAMIRAGIREGGGDYLSDIIASVASSGALELTTEKAKQHASKAASFLDTLPDSAYKHALEGLVNYAVTRSK